MWKFIVVIIVLAALAVGGIYYYKQRQIEKNFLDRPVLFTVYAHSIDGLGAISLYHDPQYSVNKGTDGNKVPDNFFQISVDKNDKLEVLDIFPVPMIGSTQQITFYLVRTSSGNYGYIPQYRTRTESGAPLGKKPNSGEVY